MAAYMKVFPPLPLPTRKLTGPATASTVPDQLMTARYVYVRRGGQGTPLAPPYSGPYQVLRPGEKVFKIAVGDKEEIVTVDRRWAASGGLAAKAWPAAEVGQWMRAVSCGPALKGALWRERIYY
jgi:hypothetical protein